MEGVIVLYIGSRVRVTDTGKKNVAYNLSLIGSDFNISETLEGEVIKPVCCN